MVIACTGHVEDEYIKKAWRHQIDEVVSKPINIDIVKEILKEIDANSYKLANVVAKPPPVKKGKKIKVKTPTATPPKAVVSKAVVNPIYQTLQTFADNYRKTAADRKISPIKYKVFTGVQVTDRVIGNMWKKYQALPDANKKTYFK